MRKKSCSFVHSSGSSRFGEGAATNSSRTNSAIAESTNRESLGRLYLVSTPIGNLEDITLRALRTLREADEIACEDTRHTQKLLSHYHIRKPLTSYHEHNEAVRSAELLARLERGVSIALVSDAGMPLVSDPGYSLVKLCVEKSIPVIPIPGPSALVAALAASGLPTDEFLFVGFLPARSSERCRALERLRHEKRTIILYEAPHRIGASMAAARDILGDRRACLAREVTKVHEEFRRGRLSELAASLAEHGARGEMTLLIGPPDAASAVAQRVLPASTQSLAERVQELISNRQMGRREALKLAAKERGLSRRAAYQQLVRSREAGAGLEPRSSNKP